MLAETVTRIVHRYRLTILVAWIAHAFLIHFFVLGFTSWDGVSYRVAPVVELLQHGSFGLDKFSDHWVYTAHQPFLELLHLPFLYVFKLTGLLIGFPLVVFPLCVTGVYKLVRELTGDGPSATLGAFAYAAVPMINSQPYSGYIDFIVCALLAWFLFSLVRVPKARSASASFVLLALITTLFTMARAQGLYVVVLLFPVVAYFTFFERTGFRVRLAQPRGLVLAIAATATGAAPAIAVQVSKFLRFGSPTYPIQFRLLGVTIGPGIPMRGLFFDAGLVNDTPAELLRAFAGAWLWPRVWPIGGFYDSRNMGGGFVLVVALLCLVTFFRAATKLERALVVACLCVSVLARDFFLPRYAYTIVVAIAVVVGRALPRLAASPKGRPLFWGASALLFAHVLRPEMDLALVPSGLGPRLNLAESSHFSVGPGALELVPDQSASLVVIDTTANGFGLLLYGTKLTNRVVGRVQRTQLEPGCTNLGRYLAADPKVLFVDELDHTKNCERECAIRSASGLCRAYRIHPGTPP